MKYHTETTRFSATPQFNRLTKISSDANMKEAAKSVASKSQVDNALDRAYKNIEKIKKLQAFDLSYISGKSHFENDGMQNYVAFQLAFK